MSVEFDEEEFQEYLEIFQEESLERLVNVAHSLEALQAGQPAAPLLDEVDRELHTIKGSARTMGFGALAELVHELEGLARAHREAPNPQHLVLLIEAGDRLSALVEEISARGEDATDLDLQARVVAAISSEAEALEPAPPAAATPDEAAQEVAASARAEASARDEAARNIEVPPAPSEDPPTAAMRRFVGQQAQAPEVPGQRENELDAASFLRSLESEPEASPAAHVPRDPLDDLAWAAEGTFTDPDEGTRSIRVEASEVDVTPPGSSLSDTPAGLTRPTASTRPVAFARSSFQGSDPEATQAVGRPPGESSGRIRKLPQGEDVDTGTRGRIKRGARPEDEILRVRASRLAELDEIVSDLTLARQRLDTYDTRLHTLLHAVEDGAADAQDVSASLRRVVRDFRSDVLQVRNATGSLQHLAVDVRLRPVSALFDRVPRQVRDLARQLGKQVRVRVYGEDTEMDRVILDALRSPLTHLLRNALDHGFESPEDRAKSGKPPEGLLELRAGQAGNRIAIQIVDDGRGIDPDKVRRVAVERGVIDEQAASTLSDADAVQLVFAPGFSTKSGVTQISGRGVGMDAVRRAVEQLKGDVQVESTQGKGTRFTIHLPLTLLISRVMLVRSAGQRFALPTESIDESVRIASSEIDVFNGVTTVTWREQVLPILRLSHFLGQSPLPDPEYLRVLAVRHGKERMALVVEELLEERSVVVKPLGWPLELLPWVSGAVQDPSGEVALQLHVPQLFNRMRSPGASMPVAVAKPEAPKQTVLVVDDSIISRQRIGRALDAMGFNPILAVDGMDAIGLLERVRPLLIVTDLEMPRLDGLGLVRRVRASRHGLAHVPILIVSNRGAPQDREAGLQAGADAYLTKSEFTPDALRDVLERLL